MDVAVLGPMRVRVGDVWVTPTSEIQRRILGLLLLRAGERVTIDELLDVVWRADPPSGGARTLRFHVSKLRDILEPGRTPGRPGPIRTEHGGYQIALEPDAIDAECFETQAAAGRNLLAAGEHSAALARLDAALSLWRGDAWPDFRYDDVAIPEVHRLDELRLSAHEDRIDALLGLGAAADVVAELADLTDRHPFRERLWAQSMQALADAGRDAEALETFDRAAAILGAELGTRPNPSLQRLRATLVERSASQPIDALQPDTLPLRTSSFIGRSAELDRLSTMLSTHRLVIVIGPGGIGKSALAVEAARARAAAETIFADLSDVETDDGVALRLAHASGLARRTSPRSLMRLVEELSAALAGDETLLVLDNCEHVASGAARAIDALLTRIGTMRVLATSRIRLHASGERVLPLGPLPVPAVDEPLAIEESDAVQMFVDRLTAVRADFHLDDATSHLVAAVCRRLDGLPLALELAAARLRVLSLDELLGRLVRPLDVLVDDRATDRHRALSTTIAWSHDQLSPGARIVFRRISVLRGEFDLEAIDAVCRAVEDGDSTDVLGAVEELVDASLLGQGASPNGGFRWLATVREFAADALEDAGEVEMVERRHAIHFAQRAIRRSAGRGASLPVDVDAVRRDVENQAAALDRALALGDGDLVAPLAAGLSLDWYAVGPTTAAIDRLRAAAATTRDDSPERAAVLRELGLSLPWSGRADEARIVAEELDGIARRHHASDIEADALWIRAAIAWVEADVATHTKFLERGLSVLRSIDHPTMTIFLFDLASAAIRRGNFERSTELIHELDRESRIRTDSLAAARVSLLCGDLAFWSGDVRSAVRLTTQALASMRADGLIGPQPDALRSVFDVAVALGDLDLAGRAASDHEALVASNGDIVTRSLAEIMRSRLDLECGDEVRSAHRLADALASIHRTKATAGLDGALAVAALLANRRGRHDLAAEIVLGRAGRLAARGLVDPEPVRRRLATIVTPSRLSERSGSTADARGWRELLELAASAAVS